MARSRKKIAAARKKQEPEGIVFEDINCVDADGNVFEMYDRLTVCIDPMCKDGRIRRMTLAIAARSAEEEGAFLPSSALTCNLLAQAFERRRDPQMKAFLDTYQHETDKGAGRFLQNTVVDFTLGRVIHYPHREDIYNSPIPINERRPRIPLRFAPAAQKSCSIEEIVSTKNPQTMRFLQNLTGLYDLDVLSEIGHLLSYRADLRCPKTRVGTMGVWIGCDRGAFRIETDHDISDFTVAHVAYQAPPKGEQYRIFVN